MGAEIALEKQLDFYRTWRGRPGAFTGAHFNQLRHCGSTTLKAHTFFVGKEISALLVEAIKTFPDDALPPLKSPTRHGFCWMEDSLGVLDVVTNVYIGAHAFQWGETEHGLDVIAFPVIGISTGTGISRGMNLLCQYAWDKQDHSKDQTTQAVITGNAHRNSVADTHSELIMRWHNQFKKFVISLFWFAEQRISQTPELHIPRPTARRWEKATGQEPPMLRVVQLRAAEPASHKDGASEPVDWQCRWIVRGHWRNQWYRSEQKNKPLFVPAHVKGPADKPLKTPKHTIFSVSR